MVKNISSWDYSIFPEMFNFDYQHWLSTMPECPPDVQDIKKVLEKVRVLANKVTKSRYNDKPSAIEKFTKFKKSTEQMLRNYYHIDVRIPNKPPNELLVDIMGFCEIRELEKCRFINKCWNKTIIGKKMNYFI